MAELEREFAVQIAELARDRSSGATELVRRALRLVQDVRRAGGPIAPVAATLCRAQPSMAPFWALAAEALAAERDASRFDRFVQRLERSPRALVRVAAEHLAPANGAALRLVTLSASGSVQRVLEALGTSHRVHVSCSESRPALEGRTLAAGLAAQGIAVTLFTDAAIAHALEGADAVLVGADAIAPAWVLNKSGTTMLAAAATGRGVPVYVVATREKFVPHAIASRLTIRDGASDEVWEAPAAGVEVRNPYFERTPVELVSAVISDAGILGTGMLPDACATALEPGAVAALVTALD